MKYTVSADALVAHLEGEVVVLHAGTRDYFRLNETGQDIWRALEAGLDTDAIVDQLTAAYDVSAEQAHAEVLALIAELERVDLVRANAAP